MQRESHVGTEAETGDTFLQGGDMKNHWGLSEAKGDKGTSSFGDFGGNMAQLPSGFCKSPWKKN